MAKLSLKAGTTSKSVSVFIEDTTSPIGAGLTGLVFNSASLTAYWYQPGVTAPAAITLATLASAITAYSSGGFVELSAANVPGHYRFDIPNAVLTGATSAVIVLKGAANMAQVQLDIQLDAVDYQDAAAFGLSRIDAAISSRGTSTLTQAQVTGGAYPLSTDASGRVDIGKVLGTAAPASNVAGVLKVDTVYVNGTSATPVTNATIQLGSDNRVLASADAHTSGVTVASTSALGTQAKADVNAEADAALADVGLTTAVTGRMDVAISTVNTTIAGSVGTVLNVLGTPAGDSLAADIADLEAGAGDATAANQQTIIELIQAKR